MNFQGQIRIPGVDHPGVPATFVIDETQAEIVLDGESLGRWSLVDVHVTRLVASAFQVELLDEQITFMADDPIEFAYRGVEYMAEVWAKYTSMAIPRRAVAISRTRKGTKPSKIPEFHEAILENLAAEEAKRVPEPAAEEPPPLPSEVEGRDASIPPEGVARSLLEPSTSGRVEEASIPLVGEEPELGVEIQPQEDPKIVAQREALEAEQAALREQQEAERQRLEDERESLEELERQRIAREREELKDLEAQRREMERARAEQEEADRERAARLEAQRREIERARAEQDEADRKRVAELEEERQRLEELERQRIAREREESERLEAQRREMERARAEQEEADRERAARLEAQRREIERAEAELVEAAHLEQERIDAERAELERIAAERVKEVRGEEEAKAAGEAVAAAEAAEEVAAEDEAVARAEAEKVERVEAEKVSDDEPSEELVKEVLSTSADDDPDSAKDLVVDLDEFKEDEGPDVTPTDDEKTPEPALAGAPEKSGIMGAVKSAFTRGAKHHEHDFAEAPGSSGMIRYVCRECGFVSIGSTD